MTPEGYYERKTRNYGALTSNRHHLPRYRPACYPTLPYHILSYPILPYPTLPYPTSTARQSASRRHCSSSASFTPIRVSLALLFIRIIRANPCTADLAIHPHLLSQPVSRGPCCSSASFRPVRVSRAFLSIRIFRARPCLTDIDVVRERTKRSLSSRPRS